MALKRKVSKADFDAMPDAIKEHYKADGDNYVLDADDADELRRGKDREKEARTQAEKERDDLKTKLKEMEDKVRLEKLGDVATLDKSWKEKYDNDIKAERDKFGGVATLAQKLALKGVAAKVAGELFTVPDVMEDRIAGRLTADLNDLDDKGLPKVKVLDKEGKISALTLDDLKKEFRAEPSLAKIVIQSRSSGSAIPHSAKPPAAVPGAGGDKPADLSKLSATDLVATINARKGQENGTV